jgi:hypothetical protein
MNEGELCCIARSRASLPRSPPSLTLSTHHIREGFMIARSRIFLLGLIFATATSFSMLSTAADAYTPELEQM